VAVGAGAEAWAGRAVLVPAVLQVGVWSLERVKIRRVLTDSVFGAVTVRNDATAWAALVLAHGGPEASRTGGTLSKVRSHARAALACAWVACRSIGDNVDRVSRHDVH